MCGICGWILPEANPVDHLVKMNAAASHRGPDGEGYWVWDGGETTGLFIQPRAVPCHARTGARAAFGHRRLAILDLSAAGAQPMVSTDGKVWITFNGEIYNYVELQDELRRLGHSFRSGTDTEVILAAYDRWGSGCFARFNGMWGLAIADFRRRVLVLSRDRLGIKPLYTASNDRSLLFASEIKQLFASGHVRAVANRQAIAEYIESGYDTQPGTMFDGVRAFPPGCWGETSLDRPLPMSPVPYWRPRLHQPSRLSIGDAVAETRHIFRDAVRLQLRSDVPIGVCLSGGLDSSAIFGQARLLARETHLTLGAFSAAFDDVRFDERPFINTVLAAHGGTGAVTFPAAEGFLADCEKFVYHHDEPPGSLSQYASWSVMGLARQSETPVVLNGQGGDELFSGYWPAYYVFLRQHPVSSIRHLVGALVPGGNPALVRELLPHLKQYLHRRRSVNRGLLLPSWEACAVGRGEDWARRAHQLTPEEYRLAELCEVHLPRLLKWDDRNSMAFSVEGRYPFLDHRLVEWALTLPPELNLHRGWNKLVLRNSLAAILPASIRWRRSKVGFVTPQSEWIRTAMRPVLQRWAVEHSDQLDQIVDRARLRRFTDDVLGSNGLHRMDERHFLLVRLFLLDRWLHRFNVAL